MSNEDNLRGHFLRNIRRPLEKAKSKGRATIELEIGDLELLLDLVEEDRAKLVNTELNRDQMLAKLHDVYEAIERGWPGLLDAMVDPVAALDIIASPSKLADWKRRKRNRETFGSDLDSLGSDALGKLDASTVQALRELEPAGWYMHEDAAEREPWAASSGDMTAIAPTPELLLRAVGMCSAECPVVHIQADGRLACECNEPGGEDHEGTCPLHRHNTASYAYAVEVGQA